MAVLGLGGVFIKSEHPEKTKNWYRDVLEVEINAHGGMDFLHKRSADAYPQAARTVFDRFEAGSDYFAPSGLAFMINLIVDDLDAAIERVEAAGETMVGSPESYDYGRFAWVIDPDGVKVELWEPVEPA
ncbi:MAG: VOC family protein [Oceanicaulis sp.]